jgi:hypothetical protein
LLSGIGKTARIIAPKPFAPLDFAKQASATQLGKLALNVVASHFSSVQSGLAFAIDRGRHGDLAQ